MHVDEWFFQWLEYHQMLHRNRQWIRSENPNAPEIYAGWIESFERIGATSELAHRASRRLQENPPKFLNEHLPAIRHAIFELRKSESTTATQGPERATPDQVQAAIESHECPECDGTGWARRQAYWPSLRWSPFVDMFCRCPHGRWRKITDADLRTDGRNYDDLQAWPSLWNPDLTFPLWSNRPVKPESIAIPETEGKWHYLPPSRPAPVA